MTVEAEIKAKFTLTEKYIQDLGAKYVKTTIQQDTYYQHPCRDYSLTDEALRIRVQDGEKFLTYKGPKLDEKTKSRIEYEIPTHDDMEKILDETGFKKSGMVKKTRKIYSLKELIICLDDVENLGKFIEIESTSLNDIPKMFKILETIGINKDETIRESYLELLK